MKGVIPAVAGVVGGVFGLLLGEKVGAYLYARDLLPGERAFGGDLFDLRMALAEGYLLGAASGIALGLFVIWAWEKRRNSPEETPTADADDDGVWPPAPKPGPAK